MKKFLLTLATAAFVAGTMNAQLLNNGVKKQAVSHKVVPTAAMSEMSKNLPSNISLNNLQPISFGNVSSAARPLRSASAVRNAKSLGYLYDYSAYDMDVNSSECDLELLPLGSSYSYTTFQKYNYGIGYATAVFSDMLKRFAGNKITSISFYPWMGVYTSGEVFILNSSGTKVWSADCDIEGLTLNTVDCDYTITGSEGNYLLIGYSAMASADSNDPYASQYGVIVPMLENETDATAGNIMMIRSSDKSQYSIFSDLSSLSYSDGTSFNACAPIWISTEGDGGMLSNDVAAESVSDVRTKGYSVPVNTDLSFVNMGLNPVTSLDYTYTLYNASGVAQYTKSGTYTPSSPIPFYSIGTLPFEAMTPAAAEWGYGSIEITNVNGVADESTSNYENLAQFYAYSLGNYPADRRALVEEYTSVGCGYCPRGIVGMDALIEAYDQSSSDVQNNKVNVVTIHTDYGNYTDALADDTYENAVNYYASSLPSAYINRAVSVDPFYGSNEEAETAQDGIIATVADYLTSHAYSEANLGFTSEYDKTEGTVTVNANIDFVTSTLEGEYSIGYILTESELTGTQLNYYAGQSVTGDLASLTTKSENYKATYNNVSRYNTNCQGIYATSSGYKYYDAENAALPAAAAGSRVTHSEIFNMPSGVDDASANIVAVLYDNKTGEVVQTSSAWLGYATTGIEKAETAKNASVSIADGAFNVTAENATAEVYSLDGKLVSSCNVNGTASLPTFGKGVYVIRVVSGKNVVTRKATF